MVCCLRQESPSFGTPSFAYAYEQFLRGTNVSQRKRRHSMERAATKNGPLVVSRTEEGFRVYAVRDRFTIYIVEDGACTCPDFAATPNVACEHIEAAERFQRITNGSPDAGAHEKGGAAMNGERSGEAQLILKRSVSPDGRIDSLSVEVTTPVATFSGPEITATARQVLGAQTAIITEFLARTPKPNGQRPNGNGASRQDEKSPAAPARVVGIGGMDGKWGRRLFLTIEAEGRHLRLFGNRKELAERLAGAGWRFMAGDITEGLTLDVPCRILTKPTPDGRYLNVEQLLPAENGR
jgi:hypothetical protein